VNFGLSEEQELLQETIDRFISNECGLVRLHEIFDGDSAHDPNLWEGLMTLGLGGLTVPESYGGAGLELVDLALAAEVMGRHALPGPYLGHALAALAIQLGGSEAQKERWLPGLATGDRIGTLAVGEGDGVWDPAEWTVAAKKGRITGRKVFVLCGGVADLIVVGCSGGGLAVVERESKGVSLTPFDGSDRTRRLDGLELSDAAGEMLVDGATASSRVRDAALCILAADAFGGASRCLDMATDYAKQREQFGVKIGQFQGIKHELANLASEVEPARALFWYAAHAWDALPDQSERAAALAKSHLPERFAHAAYAAAEIFGGIGVTWEADIQIWLKRAIFDRGFFGDTRSHRERAAQLAGW